MSTTAALHPGEVLQKLMDERGLTQEETARRTGVTQAAISFLIRGDRGLTPRMALRLEAAFGKPATWWLDLQRDYDLPHLRRAMAAELHGIRREAARA